MANKKANKSGSKPKNQKPASEVKEAVKNVKDTTKEVVENVKDTAKEVVKEVVKDVAKEVKEVKEAKKPCLLKGFFAKKYDASENILTIFKRPKTYASLFGEFFGTAVIAMLLLTIGVSNPIFLLFTLVVVTLAVYTLSGANLNPLVTAGMMATRRLSPIRGVLYILAQIFGAWAGYGLMSLFASASAKAGASPLQTMAKLGENAHLVVLLELIGAIMIGFFFARALVYKKHAFMFSVVVGGGVMTAVLLMLVASSMAQMNNSFILNPAVAIVYQILPSSGSNAGEIIREISTALGIYFAVPMLGGVFGFYLSDLMTKISGTDLE